MSLYLAEQQVVRAAREWARLHRQVEQAERCKPEMDREMEWAEQQLLLAVARLVRVKRTEPS